MQANIMTKEQYIFKMFEDYQNIRFCIAKICSDKNVSMSNTLKCINFYWDIEVNAVRVYIHNENKLSKKINAIFQSWFAGGTKKFVIDKILYGYGQIYFDNGDYVRLGDVRKDFNIHVSYLEKDLTSDLSYLNENDKFELAQSYELLSKLR